MRRAVVLATVAAVSLVLAQTAFAHAILSPPVAKSKVLQQFTLSVPTEEANSTSTQIELTVPRARSAPSSRPARARRRSSRR